MQRSSDSPRHSYHLQPLSVKQTVLYVICICTCIHKDRKKYILDIYKRQPNRQSQKRLKLLYIWRQDLQHGRFDRGFFVNYYSARVYLPHVGVASAMNFLTILTPQSLKRLCKCKRFNETSVFSIPPSAPPSHYRCSPFPLAFDFEFDIPNNTHYLAAADTTCLFIYQRFSRII